MEKKIMSHTDLVLELQQELEEDTSLLEGITVKKRVVGKHALREVCITVDNEEGERTLGKPRGTYITLEGTELAENDGGFHREMSRLLADNLQRLLGEKRKIFFAGLGNARVTPDALGPLVIQNLLITRHLGELSYFARMRSSMALAPGVMAQTGMETGEILKGIIEKSRPEALVLIDALAAKPDDSIVRYRNRARFRRGEQTAGNQRGHHGDTGDCHRCAHRHFHSGHCRRGAGIDYPWIGRYKSGRAICVLAGKREISLYGRNYAGRTFFSVCNAKRN